MRSFLLYTFLALTLFGATGKSNAQEQAGLDLSFQASIATDYRYRGYSRSDGDPTANARADGAVPIGPDVDLFAGTSVSTLGDSRFYGRVETEIYGGLARRLGAFDATVGLRSYLFPDAQGRDYSEIFGSGRTAYGPASAKLGFAIAPRQRRNGGERGLYLYSDVDSGIPNTPVTIAAHIGWEDNARFGSKLDWSLGATYVRNPFSIGIAYVDTNRTEFVNNGDRTKNIARAGILLTASTSF